MVWTNQHGALAEFLARRGLLRPATGRDVLAVFGVLTIMIVVVLVLGGMLVVFLQMEHETSMCQMVIRAQSRQELYEGLGKPSLIYHDSIPGESRAARFTMCDHIRTWDRQGDIVVYLTDRYAAFFVVEAGTDLVEHACMGGPHACQPGGR